MLRHVRYRLTLAAILGFAAATSLAGRQGTSLAPGVDQVFARWTDQTPGCAVGVSSRGRTVLEKAYGMASLEHAARNTPETIFEAGSVAKQFTAAAVLLLARDGRLSLDEPARKYVPELPDYGESLTIRHLLTHTSGLRDWGSVAGLSGWPRTTRVHTHAHVLDIVSRQRELNFPPGTRYSYSNTGYNLAAIIVARVSGQSFAEFSRTRIFEPLGMARTSWRDDHTTVVQGRAVAYSEGRGGFRTNMPFEDVHGNGGLLTTVGDLLRWTANFAQPAIGDAALFKQAQEPGRFSDGRVHDYAAGLRITTYKGVREVGHSGSTAGYRAYLADYPDQRISVAVLCNVSTGNATQYAHAVADLYLGGAIATPVRRSGSGPGASYELKLAEIDAVVGLYRRTDTGEPMRIARTSQGLRIEGSAPLRAESGTRFVATNGRTLEIVTDGRVRLVDRFGTVDLYDRIAESDAGSRPLNDYIGTYSSDEAEVSMSAAVDSEALVLRRRPDSTIRLTPVYADVFRGSIGLVRFHRARDGLVTGFSVSQDRVWDMKFMKVADAR